jgi:hypothetical protein
MKKKTQDSNILPEKYRKTLLENHANFLRVSEQKTEKMGVFQSILAGLCHFFDFLGGESGFLTRKRCFLL